MTKHLLLTLSILIFSYHIKAQTSNERRTLVSEKWRISTICKKYIADNDAKSLDSIFENQKTILAYKQQCLKSKKEIAVYRNSSKLDLVDWTPDSIIQTFATFDKNQKITILFQFIYQFKESTDKLLVYNTSFVPVAEISDKERIMERLKNQMSPPDEVNPGIDKPFPPIPEHK